MNIKYRTKKHTGSSYGPQEVAFYSSKWTCQKKDVRHLTHSWLNIMYTRVPESPHKSTRVHMSAQKSTEVHINLHVSLMSLIFST